MAIYKIQEQGGQKIFKCAFYIFLFVTAITFIHHYAIMKIAKNNFVTAEVKNVFSGIKQSKETSNNSIDIIKINGGLHEDRDRNKYESKHSSKHSSKHNHNSSKHSSTYKSSDGSSSDSSDSSGHSKHSKHNNHTTNSISNTSVSNTSVSNTSVSNTSVYTDILAQVVDVEI